jgi:hypothetical protein
MGIQMWSVGVGLCARPSALAPTLHAASVEGRGPQAEGSGVTGLACTVPAFALRR